MTCEGWIGSDWHANVHHRLVGEFRLTIERIAPRSSDHADYPHRPPGPRRGGADRGRGDAVNWHISHRAEPTARAIADRHYNRQSVGAVNFCPPGRAFVLVIPDVAVWVTSWPFAEYVKHAWGGAWVCSAFRNERPDLHRSSDLIREAVAATRWRWPAVPALGMITFVDTDKTRRKRDPGRCYRKAGFSPATPRATAGGLIALQLLGADMPAADVPLGAHADLFDLEAS